MFNFPWTNFHELNLDWILSIVKEAKEVFDNGQSAIDYAIDTAEEAKTIATQAAEATIPDNSISTAKLQDGSVTNAKMANNSVNTTNLVNGSVTNAKLADNSVTGAKIADGEITKAKLVNNLFRSVDLAVINTITTTYAEYDMTDISGFSYLLFMPYYYTNPLSGAIMLTPTEFRALASQSVRGIIQTFNNSSYDFYYSSDTKIMLKVTSDNVGAMRFRVKGLI